MLLGALLAVSVGKGEGKVEGCELGAAVVVGAPEAVGSGEGGLELLGDCVGAKSTDANNGGRNSPDTTRAMEGFFSVDSSTVIVKRIAANGPPVLNKKSSSWSV
jgi:hypothetical protein